MKKTITDIIVCLLLSVMLPACAERDDENRETYIELESEEIVFNSEGGTMEFSFKTSAEWTAVPYHTRGNWCSINKTEGAKGKSVVSISVSANDSYEERNTAIQIRCKELSRKIVVTQKQKDAILLSSNKIEIDQNGGERQLVVDSNVGYECVVESGSEWIKIVSSPATKGLATTGFSLKIAPNPYFEKRQGVVVIKSESVYERIDIYQAASVPMFVLSDNELIAKSSGDTLKVEITSNCDYSYVLPEVDWIYETESSGQSVFTLFFEIKPNESLHSRVATVVFTNLYDGSQEKLNITQLPKNAITTARSEYNLNTSKAEILLRLNSNVDFGIDVPVDWIHVGINESSEQFRFYDISMVVDENSTHMQRDAVISFYTVEMIQRVVVRQDGRADYIKAVISNNSTDITFSLSSGKLYGFVDWGDGSRNELIKTNNHSYTDTIDRKMVLDWWGAGSFKLPSLTNISSVEIYVNEKRYGDVESFVVEKKYWDLN